MGIKEEVMNINEKMFREYDIRGIYGTDITDEIANLIGKAFGSYIRQKGETNTLIGYDNRSSSPNIFKALKEGILSTGIDVVSLGLVTTPMYYYAKKANGFETGIMITASHNPKEYNGFKISFDRIGNAYGKMIQDFKDYLLKGEFLQGKGTESSLDIKQDYINLLHYSLNLGFRKVKVVVDCGNGTASIIIKDILDGLGITYYPLYCDSDPTFPNHHPDPSVPENLADLSKKVVELKYHLGIAFDGDADRVGLVDENGKVIPADLIMDIFYRDLKNKIEPKKAIYDVKCSNALVLDLKKMGYKTLMYRTGNSYMNAKIQHDHYMFGGEYSGHIWFNDRFPGFDDGIYAGLRLVEIISNTDKSVSMLLDGITQFFSTKEIKVPVKDETKFQIVEKVKEYAINKKYPVFTIDGVRVEFEDGFALVRASNTGPDLTMRFEARTEERMNELKEEFETLINHIKESI
jgi:phosphomannomutase/phosphoglucomutase